jgi:flagellar hook-length control protein FliK
MQTSLMFIDLPTQGQSPGIEKIAVKMPKGQKETHNGDCGGFADIINALMAKVPADELRQSLKQLEWISSEEGSGAGLVPLLDLTQDQGQTIDVAGQLLDEAAPGTLLQTESLKSLLFPFLGQPGIQNAKPQMETGENAVGKLIAFLKAAGEEAGHGPGKWQIPSVPNPAPDVEGKSAANPDPDPATKTSTTAADMMAAKVYAKEAKPSVPDMLNGHEMPLAKHEADGQGTANPSTDGGDKKTASMSLLQQIKGQPGSEERPDQQLADDAKHKTDLASKAAAKTHSGKDAPAGDFKPGIVDGSTDTAQVLNHSSADGGTGNQASLQGSMDKMKSSAGGQTESVAGGKEMNPTPTATRDMQSDVIRQIVQRMTLHSRGNQSTMTIHLKPEFLGQVQMEVSTEHQQVTVRMATESMAVKHMVEQGLQHLKSELQQQGLHVHKFDVFVANDNESPRQGQDWSGFRQNLKRRQRQGPNQNEGEIGEGPAPIARDAGGRSPLDTAGEINYFA